MINRPWLPSPPSVGVSMHHRLSHICLIAAVVGCGGTTPPVGTPEPAAAGAGSHPENAAGAARQVTAVADEYWKELIETFPLYGVYFGVPETPNDRLNDNSLSTLRAFERKEDRWLQRLSAVDDDALRGRPE